MSRAVRKPTILVVEDDPQFGPYLKELLEGEGYLCLLAANGDIGLRLYREHHPDLVITDLVMPNREGIELIQDLRGIEPGQPIIAISGGWRLSGTYLGFAAKLGADAVLGKPFTPDELLSTIKGLLA